jgi:hypothetical protein
MATMLGQENRSKTGKIGPVNNGLGAAGAFMKKIRSRLGVKLFQFRPSLPALPQVKLAPDAWRWVRWRTEVPRDACVNGCSSSPKAIAMTTHPAVQTLVLCLGLLTLTGTHAQVLNKADYKANKARISADYKTDKAACKAHAGNAKDVCHEEAKAKEKVALAELAYNHSGKPADRNQVAVTKAKVAYDVAKERCDDLAGNAKNVCVEEAKAVEKKALADAKMSKDMGEAKKDAVTEKVDADYNVAHEKCQAHSGETKANCIADAKGKFGKN